MNSFVTGADERSGLSRTQLQISQSKLGGSQCREQCTHFKKYARPVLLFSRKEGRNLSFAKVSPKKGDLGRMIKLTEKAFRWQRWHSTA